jgi:predicted dehydrogenase
MNSDPKISGNKFKTLSYNILKVAGMERLRAAVIGVGDHGRNRHLVHYMRISGVEVVAVADINKDRLKKILDEFGIKGYIDYMEMLERERPDVVSIVTPTGLHARIAVDAIRLGAHVLVDKPLAGNLEEAAKVVSEARYRRRILMVGYWSRFSPALDYALELRELGAIGGIYTAYAYIVRRRGIPGKPTFVDKSLSGGGGALLDIGCYALDNALAIMGFPRPISASGAVYTKFGRDPEEIMFNWGSWDPGSFELEDYAAGFVRFEGGITMTIEAGWAANVSHPGEVQRIRILGDRGGLEAMGREEILKITFHSRSKRHLYDTIPVIKGFSPEDLSLEMVRSFIESVLKGRDPPVTGEQSLVIHAIIDAIYESSRKGEEVKIQIPII